MTIFYVCPWAEKPTGGIKQIFRHVEALCAAGFDAQVLALEDAPDAWFGSTAPVASVQVAKPRWRLRASSRGKNRLEWLSASQSPWIKIGRGDAAVKRRLDAHDVLVLPEYAGRMLSVPSYGPRVVVFNQNAHYTFNKFDWSDSSASFIYRLPILAALAVSSHTGDYLRFAFPELRTLTTPNGVDCDTFRPPASAKKKQIAFMPRKMPSSIVQVIQMLQGRGVLSGWTLCAIDGVDEARVAELLRESAFFLSTCQDEGFGLPPLEAAASACIVVGFTGYGANEFMRPEYCYPVAQGDVLALAQTLEKLLREYEVNPARLIAQSQQFVAFVRNQYSKPCEAQCVVSAWQQLAGELRSVAHQGSSQGTTRPLDI